MRKIDELYNRHQEIKAAYEAAKKAGDDVAREKARADMRALREELDAQGDEFCFVFNLLVEMDERGNEHIDLHDVIWEPEKTIETLRKYGVETFVFSSGWSSAVETAWAFVQAGCKLEGMVEINDRYSYFDEGQKKRHGYLFTIVYPQEKYVCREAIDGRLDDLFERLVEGRTQVSRAGEIVRAMSRLGYRWNVYREVIGTEAGEITCTPAAEFLIAVLDIDTSVALYRLLGNAWCLSDEAYTRELRAIYHRVLDFLAAHPELEELFDDLSMYTFGAEYDKEIDG